jgi:hypothetical protein
MKRKPIGVWVLLPSGEQWMYCREGSLDDALLTARTLRGTVPSLDRGPLPLFPRWRVWLAPPPTVGRKPELARYRKDRAVNP